MATCNKCGQAITFRYIDGRPVPIHEGGGWHCGFQAAGSSTYIPPRPQAPIDWVDRDFTRPTTCPECGDPVFFIRHNGGSVWVDELG